jgi:hypothetical protein
MTAAVLERPVCQESLLGKGATLESVLCAALDEARTSGSTECPVCHSRMTLMRAGARGMKAPVADCGGCGSRLSLGRRATSAAPVPPSR